MKHQMKWGLLIAAVAVFFTACGPKPVEEVMKNSGLSQRTTRSHFKQSKNSAIKVVQMLAQPLRCTRARTLEFWAGTQS